MLNINKSIDENYRYKMPAIITNFKGGGNGKFTIITNIEEISNSLNTPSEIINKYISYTIGSSYNDKDKSITGHHYNLQDTVFEFINNFIICTICGIPELSYNLEKISNKKNNLICKCSACGNINELKSSNKVNNKCIDTISKYLLKNNWTNSKEVINVKF